MRTFKEYLEEYLLTEEQQTHSVFQSITNNFNTPPVFFTPTVMKRLNYTKENVIAYHGTNMAGFEQMAKRQGKKSTQVSVVSGKNETDLIAIMSGVETTGGIILELEGDVNISFNRDAFTARVEGGRRSVLTATSNNSTSDFHRVYSDDRIVDLGNELQSMMANVAKSTLLKPLKNISNDSDTSRHMRVMYEKMIKGITAGKLNVLFGGTGRDISFQRMIQMVKERKTNPGRDYELINKYLRPSTGNFVRSYMDGMEKILSQDKYREMFAELSALTDERWGYDESIMSNFNIKWVYFRYDNIRQSAVWALKNSLPLDKFAQQANSSYPSNFIEMLTKKLRSDHNAESGVSPLSGADPRNTPEAVGDTVMDVFNEYVKSIAPKAKTAFIEDRNEKSVLNGIVSDAKNNPNSLYNQLYNNS